MECYATPWPLWRESRILWHIVELSFAFEGLPLSPPPSFVSLFCLEGGLRVKEGIVIYNSLLYSFLS